MTFSIFNFQRFPNHGLALSKRIRLRAERHRDIRRRDIVLHTELLPCGTVPVLRHAAVGEVDFSRVAVGVVGDAAALVGDQ